MAVVIAVVAVMVVAVMVVVLVVVLDGVVVAVDHEDRQVHKDQLEMMEQTVQWGLLVQQELMVQ
jgi:hypothetical protein